MTTATLDTATPRPATRGVRRGGFVRDTWHVMVRELKPVLREPFSIFMALVQPLVFLALFAPLLPDLGPERSALAWFVPGIVAMGALVGASFTGSNLSDELASGSHERLLVTPIRRSALLVGRALKEIVPMVAQTTIIVALCAPFSFEVHPLGILVGVVILAVFCVGIGALSYAMALAAKGQEWVFWAVQQTVLFPTLLVAGVLLPLDDAPRWLRVLSDVNPLTYIVAAERELFSGQYSATTVLYAFIAAGIVAGVGLLVGVRQMRRSGR